MLQKALALYHLNLNRRWTRQLSGGGFPDRGDCDSVAIFGYPRVGTVTRRALGTAHQHEHKGGARCEMSNSKFKISPLAYRRSNLAPTSPNHKWFQVVIVPLSLKPLSNKWSDDKLGWATILNINPYE